MKRALAAATLGLLVVVGCETEASRESEAARVEPSRGAAPPRAAQRASGGVVSPLRHVPGEYLVRFRPSRPQTARSAAARAAGADIVREFRSAPGLGLVRARPGQGPERVLQRLRSSGEVVYAEPNYIRHVAATPSDPLLDGQWGLHNLLSAESAGMDIHAPQAWDLTTGSPDVVVAVLDTGVDLGHPDLAPNLWRNPLDCDADGVDSDGNGYVDDCNGIDTITGTGDPADDEGHGTHVAGILGAVGNDGLGIAGVAWRVGIVSCKWLDANGDGTDADVVACFDYVAALKDRGVNVVATNNSWVGGAASRALVDAIDAQRARGILLVAAAGNDGFDNDSATIPPCAADMPNVICVGASDSADRMTRWSGWGVHSVHLCAPGVDILSTYPASDYALDTGTSMSTPFVTGAVALLNAYRPGIDWREVKNRILAGGDVVADYYLSRLTVTGRRLDVYGALTCTDSEVLARLRPTRSDFWAAVGTAIPFSVLHVRCGAPAGDVTLSMISGGGALVLRDDGLGADRQVGDGVYSGTWTPATEGVYQFESPGSSVVVHVDADLAPGFPVQTVNIAATGGGGPNALALVGDIDGDGKQEILVSGHAYGPLYAFRGDGSLVPGWPAADFGGFVYPTLAHLRPGAADQVVAAINDNGGSGGLVAFDGGAAVLAGWPSTMSTIVDTPSLAAPTATDVDGDGLDEIFHYWEWSADGRLYARVPAGLVANTAVADLLGDGDAALITAYSPSSGESALDVRRLDGSYLPGFPVTFRAAARTYPVVGDVDGDGHPEIVLVGGGAVLVYAPSGTLKRSIPLADVAWGAAPALADLDGDGAPEIVVQTDTRLLALRGDGTSLPGWPVSWENGLMAGDSSPVVGDIDGDGAPEVVITTTRPGSNDGTVRAFRRDGTPHPRFPKDLPLGSSGSPAIADLDGDGRNELVVIATYWDGFLGDHDKIWLYDLRGASYGPVLWGQFMGNARHTGTAVPYAAATGAFASLRVETSGLGRVTSAPGGVSCGESCTSRWRRGTSVVLTATPEPLQRLVRWTGDCSGSSATCDLSMDGSKRVGAVFGLASYALVVDRAGTGSGTVTSSPAGVSCGATCSAAFDGGTAVTLTAAAASGSTFAGWSGDCAGSTATCAVRMVAALAVTARFELLPPPTHAVTVSKAGSGAGVVRSTPAGIACGATCAASYAEGMVVTLTAAAASGSTFAGWSGACAGAADTCMVSVVVAQAVTAQFDLLPPPTHAVTVSKAGSGAGAVSSTPAGVACGATCAASYAEGTAVTLTAEAASGSTFAGWSGACAGAAATCTVTVDAAQAVTAHFDLVAQSARTLTVSKAGSGAGSVTSTPEGIACGATCAASYDEGRAVTLIAAAASGSTFAGWGGACSGVGSCQVTLVASVQVTATFEATGGGSGGSSGGGGGCSTGAGSSFLGALALVLLRRRARATAPSRAAPPP